MTAITAHIFESVTAMMMMPEMFARDMLKLEIICIINSKHNWVDRFVRLEILATVPPQALKPIGGFTSARRRHPRPRQHRQHQCPR
jgi:hypothetical protein